MRYVVSFENLNMRDRDRKRNGRESVSIAWDFVALPIYQSRHKVSSRASSFSSFATMPKSSKDGKGGSSQKILNYCLWFESRDQVASRQEIGRLLGIKASTFLVTLSVMKNKRGWLEYDRDTIRLTAAGRAKAMPMDVSSLTAHPGKTDEEVRTSIYKKFKIGGKAMALLEALTDGGAHNRFATAASVGVTNKGTLAVMLSNLKKNGVIEYDATTIRLTDMCFASGKRPSTTEGV